MIFFHEEITFLGHKVTREGVEPLYSKVEAVQKCPAPTNVSELQKFLGTVGWYRSFIKHFSDISFPLHKMLQKGSKFKWTEEADSAFNLLKRKLTEAPMLIRPDPNKIFQIETDAIKVALYNSIHLLIITADFVALYRFY